MPNQPQETQSTAGSLDPQAVDLAKAIRQTESKGDFSAKGASGEYGAYQFMPDTWNAYSKAAGVNVPLEQATPEQQNEVAYKKIKQWKDQGYNPGQIASMWNAGEGKPNAYLEGNAGVNDKGVAYDTATYAKNVAIAYQQFKTQGGQQPNILGAQTAQASTDQQSKPQESLLGKIIDFAFPILPDIQGKHPEKTSLQILGDLGLSALWFVPGVGEVAGGALRGAGLLGKTGAQIVGHAIGGSATGYAADVASELSQGQTGSKVFTPGIGTASGGILGGLLGRTAARTSPQAALEEISGRNADVLGATKTGTKILTKSAKGGQDPASFLAGKGVNLQQYVNPETLHYDFSPLTSKLGTEANALDDVLSEALTQSGGTASLGELESKAIKAVDNRANREEGTVAKMQQAVKDEINAYRAQYGDIVSLTDLNGIKRGQRRISGIFDASKPKWAQDVNYQISKVAQQMVETGADKAGIEGVGEFNKYLGAHLDAAKALDKLNGTAAKGGKLGKYFQQQGLSALGVGAGLFGGGPLGAILGGLVGHFGAPLIGSAIRKAGAAPLRSALLRRAVQEDPEIVQKLQKFIGDTNTIAPFAKEPAKGLLSKFSGKTATGGLIGTGARLGAQSNSLDQ